MKKTTKSVAYSPIIPKTVSVREVQRTYRAVSDRLQREGTLMVMNYSEPDMILLSKKEFESLQKKLTKMDEELEIQRIVKEYKRSLADYKKGKLIQAKSLADLIK